VTALQPPGHNNSYDPAISAVPGLGQHTESILTGLGYSAEQISQLKSAGVV
ncbi:MAG TPA: CoA transferase, partial [Gammaproteobacteria bacterium]|nr:CoA transferase [Gammaproteobacteria bacterium]